MRHLSLTFFVFTTLISLSRPLLGDPTAIRIIASGEEKMRGQSTQTLLTMRIVRPSFTRELKLRAWTVKGKNALVEILEPSKEEGVVSLRNGDQMWNYLPKTDQVVRVPSSLMLQSWMGSDFTNDDLMKASSLLTDYTQRILKKGMLRGEKVVLIECRPKPNAPVVWGKVLYWARQTDSLPVQEKYYDERNRWVRTLAFSGFKKMDDRTVPTVIRVTKADEPKEFTVVRYHKILYDRKLERSLFDKEDVRKLSFRGKSLDWGWFQSPSMAKKPKALHASPVRIR